MRRFTSIIKDGWRLTYPYFTSEEKWSALGLLALVVAGTFLPVALTVLLNYWRVEFFNALTQKHFGPFINLLFLWDHSDSGFMGIMPGFVPLIIPFIVVMVAHGYIVQWLQIRWRRWMTQAYTNKWLHNGVHFRIGLTSDQGKDITDNPDQRIAEDVREFVNHTLSLGRDLLSTLATLFSFAIILWKVSGSITFLGVTIPGYMLWIALIYTAIFTWLTHLIGKPLFGINFRQQKVEADFRYAAVRIRENAEGIALYHGEAQEQLNLAQRFEAITKNWFAFMWRTSIFNLFFSYYSRVAEIFPFLAIAPRYFFTSMPFGEMNQVVEAFSTVQSSLGWIINQYTGNTPTEISLARWRSIIDRLSGFDTAIATAQATQGPTITTARDTIEAKHLTLALPNGVELLHDAGLTLQAGQPTLISGRSGNGKSTLFRALAGIWPYGSGTIAENQSETLFLPQRPYIPIGTLRAVVSYPAQPETHSTETITAALAATGLNHLSPELDTDEPWTARLSGGELQRLAIARAILAQPRWLFLDEATSSLDQASEQEIYQTLRTQLPNTTIVSISHSQNIAHFHDRHLEFVRNADQPGQIIEASVAASPA